MFNELYYWMYVNLQKIKTNDLPAFNAYILICLMQTFNIGTILIIVNSFLKVSISKNYTICLGFGLAFIVALINRFLLYNMRESIFEKYSGMQPKRKTKGQLYFWLYVVLSLVVFFVLGINLVTPK